MPIEPLSITSSVIALTSLTYSSCKALNDIIKGLKNVPDTLKTLRTSLDAFEAVIRPLEHDLDGLEDAVFSPEQRASLRALDPVMTSCRTSCDDFRKRLAELTSHSDDQRVALRDRLRLHFHDSDIRVLRENLAQCQRTLGDALGYAGLRTASQTHQALDKFAATYASSLSDIGGQIRGLELSFEALSMSAASVSKDDVRQVLEKLEEHSQMLKACAQVYEPALKETSSLAGTTVKYKRTFDDAREFTGNIDFHGSAPTNLVENAEARDRSRMFTGNMSAEAANNFWK